MALIENNPGVIMARKIEALKNDLIIDFLKKVCGEELYAIGKEEIQKRVSVIKNGADFTTVFIDGEPACRVLAATIHESSHIDRFPDKVKMTIPVQFFIEVPE